MIDSFISAVGWLGGEQRAKAGARSFAAACSTAEIVVAIIGNIINQTTVKDETEMILWKPKLLLRGL